jgi:hypothetical protein
MDDQSSRRTKFTNHLVTVQLKPRKVKIRRDLELISRRDFGMSPAEFTSVTRRLENQRLINVRKIIAVRGQWSTKLFYRGTLHMDELARTKRLLAARAVFLTPNNLGRPMEVYVRALLIQLRNRRLMDFGNIPRSGRIGFIRTGASERRDDIVIKYHIAGIVRNVLFEVKNLREHIYPSKRAMLLKLMRQAFEQQMQPVLIASHISSAMVRRCNALGIATYSFGKQFAFAKDRATVKKLFPNTWADEFRFVNERRVFHDAAFANEAQARDLATLGDPMWLDGPYEKWVENLPRIESICSALESNRDDLLEARLAA